MPLEIRELIIRVTVNDNEVASYPDSEEINEKMQLLKDGIVNECVEKVMIKIEKMRAR
jgi:hypothetical protein